MKMKNFKRSRVLVIALTGHSIAFEAGECCEVPDILTEICISEGLVPLDDVNAALSVDAELLQDESIKTEEASRKADEAAAESISAALSNAKVRADATLRSKRSAAAAKGAATKAANLAAKQK